MDLMVLGFALLGWSCSGEDAGESAKVDAAVDAAGGDDAAISSDATWGVGGAANDANLDALSETSGSDASDAAASVDATTGDAGLGYTCSYTFTASYQSGTIPSPPLGLDKVASDSLTVTPAPWDPTLDALRLIIRKGESWQGNGYPRSEIYAFSNTPVVGRLAFDERFHISTAFWFDPGTVFPTKNAKYGGSPGEVAIFQIHGDDGISPVLSGVVRNGALEVGFMPDGKTWQIFPYGPCPTGQRVTVLVDYEPSKNENGHLKVTVGGSVVLEVDGPNHTGLRAGNKTGGYWKQGMYDYWRSVGAAGASDSTQLVSFIDDLVICKE